MKLKYSEANIQVFFKMYARLSTANYIDTPEYKAIINDASTWPNSVFSLSVSEPDAAQKIDEIIELMRKKELPPQLRTPPNTKDSILNILRKKSVRHGTWLAMGMEMSDLIVVNTDAEISLVKNMNELKAWIEIIETELMQGGRMDQFAFQQLMNEPSCKLYLASVNGVPASTAITFVDQSSVGVYLVATAKAFQRRGIGTAITSYSVNAIQDKRIKYAYLQSTEIGESVYAKVGFRGLGELGGFAMLE
jgi:hypothetical protein